MKTLKSGLALTLALAMLLLTMPLTAAAEGGYPYGETVPAFSFTQEDAGASGLGHGIWTWGADPAPDAAIISRNDAYQLSISFGEVPNAVISVGIGGDEDGTAKAIAFWIDCGELPDDYMLSLQVQVEMNDNTPFLVPKDAKYYLKNDGGEAVEQTVWNDIGAFDIPGGFAGTLTFPTDGFDVKEVKQLTIAFKWCGKGEADDGLYNRTIYMNHFGYAPAAAAATTAPAEATTTTKGADETTTTAKPKVWPFGKADSPIRFTDEDAATTDGYGHEIYPWPAGALDSVSIGKNNGVNAMAVKFPASFTASGFVSLGIDNTKAKGKDALVFHIDASALSAVLSLKVQYNIKDTTGYVPKKDQPYYLVTDDGVFTEAAIDNDDGFLRIPAGFSGNVGVPLAADALKAAWGSDAFRVEDIPSLALLFNADTALSGKTVYLHDFGFASFAEDGQGSPITGGVLPTAATVAALCGLSLVLLTGIKKKSAR